MLLFHIVILALIQGVTEFLPISSSGHLVLAHAAMGNHDAATNLTIDIAVHVGTLLAVLLYFRHDILKMLCCVCPSQHKPKDIHTRNLLLMIILASIPVIIAGFILHELKLDFMRSVTITAWCTLIFGILLWIADKKGAQTRTLTSLTIKDALIIGFSQALALMPGTSRSGVTMTAARFLGFSRVESARFSLLLAIIAISGAGTLGGFELWESGNLSLGLDALIAAIFAFFAALGAIALMMKWLEKSSFTPFVIYRLILGLLLLGLIYGGFIPDSL